VKSHPTKITSLWQHLNETADNLATATHALKNPWLSQASTPLLPAVIFQYRVLNQSITGRITRQLQRALEDESARDYIKRKYDWLDSEVNEVDWDVLADVTAKHSYQAHWEIAKLQHGR